MREPSQSEHVRKPWKQLIDVHENLEREKTLRGRVLVVTAVRKGTSKNIKVFILFRFTEFEKILPFYKNVSVFVYRSRQSDESIEMWVRVKMWSCCALNLCSSLRRNSMGWFFEFEWLCSFWLEVTFRMWLYLWYHDHCAKKFLKKMITEDAILNFISTRVSGTGFSAS